MRTSATKRCFFILGVITYSLFIFYSNFNFEQIQFSFETMFVFLMSMGCIIILTWIGIDRVKQIFLGDKQSNERLWMFFLLVNVGVFLVLRIKGVTGSQLHGDMNTILEYAFGLKILPYQGWYATIFYCMVLMLVPLRFVHEGLVLFQILIISYIVAYVINYLGQYYGKRIKIITCAVFFLPPILLFVQFTLRTVWFAFALILLLVEYDRMHFEKRAQISFVILGCVAATLRPEGIYIIAIVGLIVLVDKWFEKIRCKAILCLIALFVTLGIPQRDSNIYKSTPFINPLAGMMIDENFEWCDEKNDRVSIDAIYNVNALIEYASKDIDNFQFHELDSENWNWEFNNEEYGRFVWTYVKLVLKNPEIFVKVRWRTFWYTIVGENALLSARSMNDLLNGIITAVLKGKIVFPIVYLVSNINTYIIYNSVIPIILLTILTCRLLAKKEWSAIFYWMMVVGEALLIFLFGTETQYMFHIQFYIPAYVGCILLWGRLSKLVNEKSFEG